MFFTRIASFATLLAVASAHFQLSYPPTRGFIEDNETQEPCGSFNTVTPRTSFPLGSTYIKLASEHEQANVLVMITFDNNPTDIKNFTTSSTGQAQPPVRNWFQIDGEDICIQVDIQSVYPNSALNGTNATIAVQYSGGDGNLYQCADIILSSTATIPSNYTCTNEYSTTAVGTATASASTTASHGGAAGQLGVSLVSLVAVFGFATFLL